MCGTAPVRSRRGVALCERGEGYIWGEGCVVNWGEGCVAQCLYIGGRLERGRVCVGAWYGICRYVREGTWCVVRYLQNPVKSGMLERGLSMWYGTSRILSNRVY